MKNLNTDWARIDEKMDAEMKRLSEVEGTSYEDAIWEMERMENDPPPSPEVVERVSQLMARLDLNR